MRVLTAIALVFATSAVALPRSSFIGPKVKPPAQVKRVVTLVPSITDIVLEIDGPSRLVGVSRYDERPEVKSLPRIGGFSDPSPEAVIALRPDLLIAQPGPGNRAAVETIAKLGVPVLLLPLEDVGGVLEAFRAVGKVLGKAAEGEQLAKELERARDEVRAKAEKKKVRVLFAYGFDPLVVAGPGSFATELLEDAGGENIVKPPAGPYVTYSVESAIVARPEVVVNAADPDTGSQKLRALPGLKEARWVRVPGQELLLPGPRLAAGLRHLYALLHPDEADAGR